MDLCSSTLGSRDPPARGARACSARAWLEHCRLVCHTTLLRLRSLYTYDVGLCPPARSTRHRRRSSIPINPKLTALCHENDTKCRILGSGTWRLGNRWLEAYMRRLDPLYKGCLARSGIWLINPNFLKSLPSALSTSLKIFVH